MWKIENIEYSPNGKVMLSKIYMLLSYVITIYIYIFQKYTNTLAYIMIVVKTNLLSLLLFLFN